jgi:hypothetical protein
MYSLYTVFRQITKNVFNETGMANHSIHKIVFLLNMQKH